MRKSGKKKILVNGDTHTVPTYRMTEKEIIDSTLRIFFETASKDLQRKMKAEKLRELIREKEKQNPC